MFQYVAYGKSGKRVRGKINAQDASAAESSLMNLGLYAMQIKPGKKDAWWNRDISLGRKVSVRDFAVFCRQMATLIRAGVTLVDSLCVLSEQTTNKALKQALVDTQYGVSQGQSFSDIIAKRHDIFPSMFVSMARAGEISGGLDDVLDRASNYFEKEFYTREKVKSALAYPTLLAFVAIIVIIFVLVKIVPAFIPVFASYNKALPWPTRFVLGVSHVLGHDWWVVLVSVVAVVLGDIIGKRYPRYRLGRDIVRLRIPIFGPLYQKTLIARMARTLSSLLSSAIPMVQSLCIVHEIVANEAIGRTIKESVANLEEGRSLSVTFKSNHFIPPMVSNMLSIGEESGNLEFMMTKLADFYEAETEANADRLESLLEPIMILVLAGIVGIIVLSVMMPSFALLGTLQ